MADLKTQLNEVAESEESVGWENEAPASGALPPPCNEIGKRHKWRGGNVCTVCGVEKAQAQPSGESRPRRSSGKSNDIAQLLSMGWSIAGSTLASRGPERLIPVGNVMYLQGPMAGPRLDRVLQGTPIYKILTSGTTGKVAEIVPLIGPPLLVGLAANANQKTKRAIKPLIVSMLLPVMVEASRAQQENKELLEKINEITSEQLEEATQLVDSILGIENDSARSD